MIQVGFHRLAAKELREAHHWYATHDRTAAKCFIEAVDVAVERIRQDPAGQPIEWINFRWVRVRRFPYRLIFEQQESETLLIIAVAHTSRRPRYWGRRK